jgi:FMN phosphatase YigB (HAD superfamily)
VLAETLVAAASSCGTLLTPASAGRIAASVGDWPLFPEVRDALRRLSRRFRIALTSNLDREDLQAVAARLGAPVAGVVAAEDLRIYKPAPELVLALLHELQLDETEALVISALPDLDLYTAEDLGVPAVFVNRAGEDAPDDLAVSLTVRDLGALADRLLPRSRPAASGARTRAGGGRRGVAGKRRRG